MVVRSGVLRISECGCHLPTRDEIGGDRSANVRKWVTSPILSHDLPIHTDFLLF